MSTNQKHQHHFQQPQKDEGDSFVELFDKFLAPEESNEVDKNAPVDPEFLEKLMKVKTQLRKKDQWYKVNLSDKLLMFNQIDKVTKDPQLQIKFDEIVQRRKKVLAAMESVAKKMPN